jgi:hypothetical protein
MIKWTTEEMSVYLESGVINFDILMQEQLLYVDKAEKGLDYNHKMRLLI